MRIDPNVTVTATSLDKDSPAPTAAKAAPARGPAAVVSLSTAATTASADPEQVAPNERLERVRALIARGAYAVDLDKLASRIVDDEAIRSGGK